MSLGPAVVDRFRRSHLSLLLAVRLGANTAFACLQSHNAVVKRAARIGRNLRPQGAALCPCLIFGDAEQWSIDIRLGEHATVGEDTIAKHIQC